MSALKLADATGFSCRWNHLNTIRIRPEDAMISSPCEPAVTRYLVATSGLYGDGESMAMLYLAREYFKSDIM
jgi:hypothetical protein